jgi:hypothetical protein
LCLDNKRRRSIRKKLAKGGDRLFLHRIDRLALEWFRQRRANVDRIAERQPIRYLGQFQRPTMDLRAGNDSANDQSAPASVRGERIRTGSRVREPCQSRLDLGQPGVALRRWVVGLAVGKRR